MRWLRCRLLWFTISACNAHDMQKIKIKTDYCYTIIQEILTLDSNFTKFIFYRESLFSKSNRCRSGIFITFPSFISPNISITIFHSLVFSWHSKPLWLIFNFLLIMKKMNKPVAKSRQCGRFQQHRSKNISFILASQRFAWHFSFWQLYVSNSISNLIFFPNRYLRRTLEAGVSHRRDSCFE